MLASADRDAFAQQAGPARGWLLIVGNSNYPDADAPLKEPLKDAARPGRRVAARRHRLRGRRRGESFQRSDAQGVRPLLRQDQARLGRPGVLQRLRDPVGAAELHHPGRRADLDRGRRAARRRQPRYDPQGNEHARRQGQDRHSRCVAAQSFRAALSSGFRRTCPGRCSDRIADHVFLGAEHRRQRHRQRAPSVRERTRQPAPRAGSDGRGGVQSHPDGRDARIEGAAGALAFVVAGLGFLFCAAARGKSRRRHDPPRRARRLPCTGSRARPGDSKNGSGGSRTPDRRARSRPIRRRDDHAAAGVHRSRRR